MTLPLLSYLLSPPSRIAFSSRNLVNALAEPPLPDPDTPGIALPQATWSTRTSTTSAASTKPALPTKPSSPEL